MLPPASVCELLLRRRQREAGGWTGFVAGGGARVPVLRPRR